MNLAIMKTMKYIVLVCALAISATLMANDYSSASQMPILPFESTSSMPMSGTQLPNAAEDGVGIVSTPVTGPHRVPALPPDPFLDPIGDAVLPLALLAAAYLVFVARKHRTAN